MSEPNSPNDEVFYDALTWHFPKGLDIKGDVKFNGVPQQIGDLPEMSAGELLPLANSSYSTSLIIANRLYFYPFDIPRDEEFDQLQFEVTTIGSAGSLLRAGLYADAGNYKRPGALITDAGTVSGESTGIKGWAITGLVANRYWAAVVGQGGPTTQPILRMVTMSSIMVPLPVGANTVVNTFLIKDGVSGGLPNPAGAPSASTSLAPVPMLRAA